MPGARFDGEFRARRYQPHAYPHWLHETTETPACRGVDPETFFPENNHKRAAVARAHCAVCPLETECRSWALDQPDADLHGIWGGLSQSQREGIHRRLRATQQAQEAA